MLSKELRFHRSLAETPWRPSSLEHVDLPSGEIHVWRLDLSREIPTAAQYLPLLQTAERVRVAKFHYARDRKAYICCRGILRSLLGEYLKSSPYDIEFHYTEYGKPHLVQVDDFHFNLSHTQDYALIAFCRDGPIGVDAEPINDDIDTETLVHRFFSPVEISSISTMPPAERPDAFFRLWTRKEALIKAHGAGLSLPLAQFGITVKKDEEVRVLHTDWAEEEAQEWSIASFTVARSTLGAIALKSAFEAINFYDYQ